MGRFLFVSLCLLVLTPCLSGAKGCCCSPGWLPIKGSCYRVFEEQKNWKDAEIFCIKHKPGCQLASIHSMAESGDLSEYISNYLTKKDNVWIGLNDPRKQRNWEWSDRSCVDYFSWNPGEPNNENNNEYCVQLSIDTDYKTWNDRRCETIYPFLCQCKS